MKILIAIPTFENIQPEVFKAIYDCEKPCDCDFEFVRGYDCAKARNKILEKAIKGKYDYCLMVDSDTVIPKDALVNMLEIPVDVCLGFCPHKNTKEGKTEIHKPGEAWGDRYYYKDIPSEPRVKIRGGGAACMLININRVVGTIQYPYFKYVVYDNGDHLSEDFYFCSQCRNRGLKLEADTRVRCGHLARYYQYE